MSKEEKSTARKINEIYDRSISQKVAELRRILNEVCEDVPQMDHAMKVSNACALLTIAEELSYIREALVFATVKK